MALVTPVILAALTANSRVLIVQPAAVQHLLNYSQQPGLVLSVQLGTTTTQITSACLAIQNAPLVPGSPTDARNALTQISILHPTTIPAYRAPTDSTSNKQGLLFASPATQFVKSAKPAQESAQSAIQDSSRTRLTMLA